MAYTFARVGAATQMRVEDVYVQGRRTWVRLHEKGGKRNEMPAHHNLEEYLHGYLAKAAFQNGKEFLFRSIDWNTGELTGRAMSQADAYRMIRRRSREAGGRMRFRDWLISVRDNGVGFDQNHADHVFEPLKRLAMNDEQGSGLGLAICKKIIHRMGGQIWAKSQVGQGSTFFFTLPR